MRESWSGGAANVPSAVVSSSNRKPSDSFRVPFNVSDCLSILLGLSRLNEEAFLLT